MDMSDCKHKGSVCNEVAREVAVAPFRETWQWKGLPAPKSGGCKALHDALIAELGKHPQSEIDGIKFGGRTADNIETADFSELENRIQLIGFLRLSAEIDRVMLEFYEMTRAEDLPIIAHASPAGFALDDQYYEYGLAKEWERALKTVAKDQRVLLAHAGGPPTSDRHETSDHDEVLKLLAKYQTVFIDLSANDATKWRSSASTLHNEHADQVVYGSDFWMTTREGDTAAFLREHRKLFSPSDAYMGDNAILFLAPGKESRNRTRICTYAKGRLAPLLEQRLCHDSPPE